MMNLKIHCKRLQRISLEWILRRAGFLETTDRIVLVRSLWPSLEFVDASGGRQRCVAWPVILVDTRGGRMGVTPLWGARTALLRGSDG